MARIKDWVNISALEGNTFTSVEGMENGSDMVRFRCVDGTGFDMFHQQDCCEGVNLVDVCGDVADLIGTPILSSVEVSSEGAEPPENADSYTWTFYRISTIKGTVVLRWLGESNGYYSESVDICSVVP